MEIGLEFQILIGEASRTDDNDNSENNATTVFFNQTIQGRIDDEGDVDWYSINSFTPDASDGDVNNYNYSQTIQLGLR